jgi:ATP-dependent protease HslVU (ClpYQ) ATPase subunit
LRCGCEVEATKFTELGYVGRHVGEMKKVQSIELRRQVVTKRADTSHA